MSTMEQLKTAGQYMIGWNADFEEGRVVEVDSDGAIKVAIEPPTDKTQNSIKGIYATDVGTTFVPTTAIYIGGFGDLVVTTVNDSDVTLVNLAVGVWHPISIKGIKASGTTATNILRGYY